MDDSQLYMTTSTGADAGSNMAGNFISLALFILIIASLWKIFTKAGRPGWAAIIPIYNTIVQLQTVGRPVWWIVLLFIPLVNIVVAIILLNDLSKSFGRGVGTTLLLLFLPFIGFPMLGFGSAKYVAPAAGGNAPVPATV